MVSSKTVFDNACYEITNSLLSLENITKKDVSAEIKKACVKYSLNRIPKKSEILSKVTGKDFERLRNCLMKKPIKTASGVAVVALMPKPYACPHGRCTYCPGGVEYNTPNSYTGHEPSTINAIENQYDPKKQITTKIDKLVAYGHDPAKLELVIVGGTFLFMPKSYQENFIKSCYDALNGFESSNLEEAKRNNENAAVRNVGFTIETKPDYCKKEHVDAMLRYGVTRVEIGVQSLRERIYNIVNRGHNYDDVKESFRIAKDAGYKIVAHMMPGLPTMTPDEDIADFKRLFEDPKLKPDMLKVYPALVVKNTKLFKEYQSGNYHPYSDQEMIRVLKEMKKLVPKWVRIMRVQREISPSEIIAGPKSGNIRQIVINQLKEENTPCKCIRCREAGLNNTQLSVEDLQSKEYQYASSGGDEIFLSYEDGKEQIFGFLRLRRPSHESHRKEVTSKTCIVRELHVYGRSLKIGHRQQNEIQHSGIGKRLMNDAETLAKERFDANRLLVISAVGTREYYKKLGYTMHGPYMAKSLD